MVAVVNFRNVGLIFRLRAWPNFRCARFNGDFCRTFSTKSQKITKNVKTTEKLSEQASDLTSKNLSSTQLASCQAAGILSQNEANEKRWAIKITRCRAYLHACLYSDDISSSLKFLNSFLLHSPQKIIQENVDLFNIILLHLARDNDLKKSAEILEKMKTKQIQPNLSTIGALLLLAVDKNNDEVNVKMVEKALKVAQESNAGDIKRIFSARVHGLDETRKILLALKAVNPDFQAEPFESNSGIGRTVYQKFVNRVHIEHKMDEKLSKIYEKYSEYFLYPYLPRLYNQRQFWQKSALECYPEQPGIKLDVPQWPYKSVLMKLGEYLLDIMLKEVKIDAKFREKLTTTELQATKRKPIFYKVFCDAGSELREHLRVDPYFAKFLQSFTSIKSKLMMEAVMSPMLCPPIPWHAKDQGYFLCSHVELIRTPAPFGKYSDKVQMALQKHENRKFFPALDALNQLGQTPWVVNHRVLDTALKIFGLKIGDSQLSIPADVSTLPQPPKMAKKGASDFIAVLKQRRESAKLRNETYSLWMTALYKLSLANYFRHDIIWFPHSLDFRGRAYPCPPYLNHMGDDLNRGILLFARGQKLGKHGLDWLKIHCINLTGLKKRDSLKERLEYANEILPDILDSADDPLNGRQWWRKSEEPWQTLAVCIEIANAVRSPNAEEYVSRCPVHQDGSCNGLQHYAALGRDELGAKQVNLIHSETPQDVYSCVASFVEEKRRLDAENGIEIAKICEGFVRRKVIKQTVMTIVYGVTYYGAQLQIERQLKAIEEFPSEHAHRAAQYLAKATFSSIGAIFNNTRKIQDWLANIASLVSGDCQKPVEWVTPLDFPVLQPYFCRRATPVVQNLAAGTAAKSKKKALSTKKLMLILPEKRKQRNGFPPNFIHSLDSSHMMLTSLHCQRLGISYASVHDCFWTHACTVDIMNKICREQFVSLHNEPILTQLSDHLLQNVVGVQAEAPVQENLPKNANLLANIMPNQLLTRVAAVIGKVPRRGTFNLDEVLKSTYFFS